MARAARQYAIENIAFPKDSKRAHARSVPVSMLYQDTDHDGIPDIVEREIGTNPLKNDSRHTGMQDGNNKNPLYKHHKLSQDEQIYQAVIEALCQTSRFALSPGASTAAMPNTGPVDPDTALVAPTGSTDMGVPIYGHAHTVLEYPTDNSHVLFISGQRLTFSKSIIGFDGKVDVNKTRPYQLIEGMIYLGSYFPQTPFKEWFPYQMSRDQNRVRIGASTSNGTFDVEVDRVDGRWLPVECRLVQQGRGGFEWFTSVPVRDEK